MAKSAAPSTLVSRAAHLGGTVVRRARGVDALGVLIPILIAAAAAALRSWRVVRPGAYVFDEVYYAADAVSYLHGGDEASWVQPPLGKWLIAGGIKALGNDPLGWRIASVVVGTIVVLLTYVLALRLLHSRWWAALAAGFVAADGLQIVQSRIGMLDIFLAAFVLAGALLVHVYVSEPSEPHRATPRSFGWLAAAGVMFGAAVAVKWSAVPVIVLAAVGIIAISPDRRLTAAVVACLLGVVPMVVYGLSYITFWRRYGLDVGSWVDLQRSMLAFHNGGIGPHPYASSSLGWLVLRRPTSYFFEASGGDVRHIVALGNPLLWWGFLATIPSLVRTWLRRGDHVADVVVLGLAATYVPWLLVRRTSFLYYLTPLVPFMAIGVVWALRRVWGSSLVRPIRIGGVTAYVVAVFVAAALLLPVWLGLPIGQTHWERLMLFPGWR